MRFTDILLRSLEGIRLNKLRVALTAFAIAIGAFALMITFSLGEGARQASISLVASSINKQVISVSQRQESGNQASDLLKEYSTDTAATTGIKLLKDSDVDKISKLQGVKKIIRNFNINPEFIQIGDKKYLTYIGQYKPEFAPEIVAGKLSGDIATNQIIIPEIYIKQLGFGSPQNAIGKQIKVVYYDEKHENQKSDTLTVVAVSKKPLSASIPSKFLISESAAKQIYSYQISTDRNKGFDSVDVVISDGLTAQDRSIIKANIENIGFSAQTDEDSAKGINDIINGLQLFLTAFAAATLLAAVFGIINTEIIGIIERQKEIGLLKAVGIHNRTLFTIFTVEAAWIGIFGTVLGIVLAFLASIVINPLISKQIDIFNDKTPALVFNFGQVIGVAMLLLIIALLSGVLPARIATKMDPIEALRTE